MIDLKISGKKYSIWKSAKVNMSMERLAGSFVGVFPDSVLAEYNLEIFMGDEFTVGINDNILVTGYVDRIISRYAMDDDGDADINLTLVGRDKTADLIDCSFGEKINEYKGLSMLAIIKKLVAPFDISVVVDEGVGSQLEKKVTTFKANEGDSPFDLITRICRDAGVLPLSYGDGYLTLTKAAASDKCVDTIVMGQNAFSVEMDNDNTDRYDEYIVKGQGISNDDITLQDYTACSGYCMDTIIERNRPKIFFSDTLTDSGRCADRAKWLMRVKAGRSRAYTYSVLGLVQSDGSCWYPNMLVSVIDDYHNLRDTMLIADVEMVYEEKGNDSRGYTKLTVVDKTTYDISSSKEITGMFDNV